MIGIAIFAHGSSVESANDAVRIVTARVAALGGFQAIEATFLEGGQPDLLTGVGRLVAQGATRIVVIPYFLTLGLHLKRDLPKLVEEVRLAFPQLAEIQVTEPLDGHPSLAQILLDRATAAGDLKQ
jgi:sirohydrochlorin ferrochelatase